MANGNAVKSKKNRKRSPAAIVFNIIFVILIVAILAVLAAIIILLTPLRSSVNAWIQTTSLKATEANLIAWVKYHVVDNFSVSAEFRGHSQAWTAGFYLCIMAFGAILGFCMICAGFLRMSKNVRQGKKEAWRKVLCILTILGVLFVFGTILSFCWRNRIKDMPVFADLLKLFDRFADSFRAGKLHPFLLKFATINPYVNTLFYAVLGTLVLEAILLALSTVGRSKKAVLSAADETSETSEEATPDQSTVLAEEAPIIAASRTSQIVAESGQVNPTIRELALLNSLEAVNPSDLKDLPGLYNTSAAEILDDLEPAHLKKPDATETEILANLEPANEPVDVLPGIDEFDANPWDERERPIETTPVVEETKPVVEEKLVEEKPVEETKPAPEEATDQPEAVESTIPAPQEPVEATAATTMEETEPEEKRPIVYAINTLPATDRRPQEEEHEPQAKSEGADRSSSKQISADNSHETVVTPDNHEANRWILPTYVPEEKPVAPAAEEKKEEIPTAPEETVVETKTEQIPVVPVPLGRKDRVHITPITPAAVAPKEEKPAEVQEEKKLAPISGPLHSTEKSRHSEIKAVEARHVRFELRNYEIKTYQGDLTPEQAFSMGVTKVQPKANPVFANQANEPAWKQKRRENAIRKNGYGEVSEVKDLRNGLQEKPAATTSLRGKSIREMVKAKKAEEAKAKVTEEEKPVTEKPGAPIKPIAPVAPSGTPKEAPAQPENPFSDKKTPDFHPIAPIAHKPAKRPDIKPINPIKPVKK